MPKLAEQLAKDLLDNLKTLADKIARKPPEFDPRWAKSIIEAFSLYTRTSTVNYFVAFGDCLREAGWPFPAYLDLEDELRHSHRALGFVKWPFPFYQLFSFRSINIQLLNLRCLQRIPESRRQQFIDQFLSRRFHKASKKVFGFWKAHPLLQSKRQVILDLEKAYSAKLWGTCIPSILPLIDYLMRDYFQTDDLRESISTLVKAFEIAKLTPESLKPGYGVYVDITEDGLVPARGVRVADSSEKDLRLPGVYLTSFVDFAFRYYSWHTTASSTEEVNRHAVLHGDTNYWSKTQTRKVLMFFDLVVKLEPVLRIIIGTEKAPSKE
jgi:hypothetical protein